MNKVYALMILGLLVISLAGFASAKTLIAGKIYNADFSETVADAYVKVTCNGNEVERNSSTNGDYVVEFTETECDVGDDLSIYASHPDYGFNTNDWTNITDKEDFGAFFDLNLGIANVNLVPEFGFFVGALTILSAVGAFFLIRKN